MRFVSALVASVTIAGCTVPMTPQKAALTFADICANAPTTRAMMRDELVMFPGTVDAACIAAGMLQRQR